MNHVVVDPSTQVHKWRRLGNVGPVYEVLGWGKKAGDDQLVRIRMVESGEEIEHKLSDILADPEEH